jgi:hypothetical protein
MRSKKKQVMKTQDAAFTTLATCQSIESFIHIVEVVNLAYFALACSRLRVPKGPPRGTTSTFSSKKNNRAVAFCCWRRCRRIKDLSH